MSRLIDSSATNELIEETNKFFIEQIQKINNVFNAMLAPLFKNTTNSNNILDFNKILHFIDEQGNVSRHNSFYVDPRVHIQDFLGKNKHLLLAIKLYMASVSYYTKTSIKTFSEEEIQPKLNLPTDYNAFQNFENGQLYNKVKNSYTKNSAIFSNFYELNTQLNKAYETKIEETGITNKINATTKNNKADSFNLNKLEKTVDFLQTITETSANIATISANIANTSQKISEILEASKVVANISNKVIKSAQKVAKIGQKAFKVFSSISKAVPYLALASVAIDVISGVIDFFSVKNIQEFYSYKATNGKSLLWDGGQRIKQFWGLRNEEKLSSK